MSLDRFKLENRVALVTGAAQGIGAAISETLASLGATVVLTDITDGVEKTSRVLNGRGLETTSRRLDVTNSAQVDETASWVKSEYGHLDVLVNNAGVANGKAALDYTDEDWRQMMSIDLDGQFYCCRAFGRLMVEQQRGSVVCISSIAGIKAVRPEKHVGYDVAKAGVAQLCRTLAAEWAKEGVRVNAVGPGYTDTSILESVGEDMIETWLGDTPMGRLMQPEEIAHAVAFLASDAASAVTGHLLMADGGYSVW